MSQFCRLFNLYLIIFNDLVICFIFCSMTTTPSELFRRVLFLESACNTTTALHQFISHVVNIPIVHATIIVDYLDEPVIDHDAKGNKIKQQEAFTKLVKQFEDHVTTDVELPWHHDFNRLPIQHMTIQTINDLERKAHNFASIGIDYTSWTGCFKYQKTVEDPELTLSEQQRSNNDDVGDDYEYECDVDTLYKCVPVQTSSKINEQQLLTILLHVARRYDSLRQNWLDIYAAFRQSSYMHDYMLSIGYVWDCDCHVKGICQHLRGSKRCVLNDKRRYYDLLLHNDSYYNDDVWLDHHDLDATIHCGDLSTY